MPQYEALAVHKLVIMEKDRYQCALAAFKEVAAIVSSLHGRQLKPGDFFGPDPQVSHDLPEGVEIVFSLPLDIDGREPFCNIRDVVSTLMMKRVFVRTGVRVKIKLEFLPIGWSFGEPEEPAEVAYHPGFGELIEKLDGSRE